MQHELTTYDGESQIDAAAARVNRDEGVIAAYRHKLEDHIDEALFASISGAGHLPGHLLHDGDVTAARNRALDAFHALVEGLFPDDYLQSARIEMADKLTDAMFRYFNRIGNDLGHAQVATRDRMRANTGSEIDEQKVREALSVELALEAIEQRAEIALEAARNVFEQVSGRPWAPQMRNLKPKHTMSAAVVSAETFHRQRKQHADRPLAHGYTVAITGGYNRGQTVQDAFVVSKLEKLKSEHKDLFLILTDEPGPNALAAKWAKAALGPDRFLIVRGDRNIQNPAAMPFRRNEAVLMAGPKFLLRFPNGNHYSERLVQIAREAGVPVARAE